MAADRGRDSDSADSHGVSDAMPDTRTQWQLFQQVKVVFPRQQNVARAWVVWQDLRPPPDAALVARMVATLAWQARDPQWTQDGGRWVPWFHTWLIGRRWEDEPFEPPSAMAVRLPGPQTRTQRIADRNQETLRRFLARNRGEES